MIKSYTRYLELSLIILWSVYWGLVIIREALGMVFLPVHDGLIALTASLLTGLYLVTVRPYPSREPSQRQDIPIWILFLFLQAFLLLQLHQGLSIVATGVFLGLTGVLIIGGVVSILHLEIPVTGWISSLIQVYHQYARRIYTTIGWGMAGIFLLIPWGVFVLSQAGISLTVGLFISILLSAILVAILRDPSFKIRNPGSLSRLFSETLTQRIFQLLFFVLCVGFGGIGYWILGQRGVAPLAAGNDSMIPLRPTLQTLSRDWRVNPDQYVLPVSSGDIQRMEFTFVADQSRPAQIEMAAVIQPNAGRLEAVLFQEGSRVAARRLPSFECTEWFQDSSLAGRIREDCQPIVDNFTVFEADVREGDTYTILLQTIPYQGPLVFTPTGEIRQGEIVIGPPRVFLKSAKK